MKRRPLWQCPKCGDRLVGRNMAHSCGRATIDQWKARMTPPVLALYARLESAIAACGEYHVAPAKTRIAFLVQVRFANVVRISESALDFTFALPKPVQSSRFVTVQEVVPGWWVHRMRVTDPADLDDEVRGWIRESYRLMGMRERLRR